jgi:hypothetical protein
MTDEQRIHRGTRAAPNSQFHISPHPGFLSQLRLPLNRELQRHTHHNIDQQRSQSPISSTTNYSHSSSIPSLLSQSFRKPNGDLHGVSNASPNLTNKRSQQQQHYHPTPPSRALSSPDESPDPDSESYDQTPPNLTMTWRTVQSRTPPNRSQASRYSQGDEDNEVKQSGKIVHDDILLSHTTADASSQEQDQSPTPASSRPQPQSQGSNKARRLQERQLSSSSSSRPLRTGSKTSSSQALREMLEADRQKADAAKVRRILLSLLLTLLWSHTLSLPTELLPTGSHSQFDLSE